LKQKKRGKKLRDKDRLTGLSIGGMGVLLFWAAFFVYEKIGGGDQRQPDPAEKLHEAAGAVPEEASAAVPLKAAPEAGDNAREALRRPAATPAAVPPERPLPPLPEHKGGLVYVIDDAGNNLYELEPFLRFPGALTIAVLPGLPHSARAARLVREAGKEVFLHQPMEAVGGADPGPGAVYIGMSREDVRAVLEENVREIGPVAGINNHQGSLVTQDGEIMRVVLEFCRDNKLYFLDSRTSADTVAPKVARDVGVKIAERNIFLDNEQDRSVMEGYLEQGLGIARGKKTAVMIGHTWSPELAGLLTDSFAGLSAQGYTFLTVSEMMKGRGLP
jgi:polysaccharide deacetylase 2 family uncharacterized protein YibQ